VQEDLRKWIATRSPACRIVPVQVVQHVQRRQPLAGRQQVIVQQQRQRGARAEVVAFREVARKRGDGAIKRRPLLQAGVRELWLKTEE
jgi:hypothetical protein